MPVLPVAVYQFERVDENKSTNPASPIFMFYVINIDKIDRFITEIDRNYYRFSSSRYRLVTPWSKVTYSAKLYLFCIICIAE